MLLPVQSHCRHRTRQRGVSLLETVLAVTIAGGVSATVLPQVAHLPGQARVAVVQSLEGAVRSATALVHMKCAVQQGCPLESGQASVAVAGDTVSLVRGYPVAGTPDGIESAIEFTGFTAQHSPGRTVFSKDGAPQPASCAVVYTEPQADGQAPQTHTLTSGC
jgi:MSHA pilin protein MshA